MNVENSQLWAELIRLSGDLRWMANICTVYWALVLTWRGSLRERSPCGSPNFSLNGWWSSASRQENSKERSISPWTRLKIPNAKTMSPPAQSWTCSRTATLEIFTVLHICSIVSLFLLIRHTSHCYCNHWAHHFPRGTCLKRREILPVDSLFPREQIWNEVYPIFIILSPRTILTSRGLMKLFTSMS